MVLLVLLNLKLNMYYCIVRKSSIRIPLNIYASLETQEFSSPHTSLHRYPNKKQYLMSRRVSMGRAFSKCYTSCNHYFCFADGRTETCFLGGARGKDSPWIAKVPWRMVRQPTPVFSPGESQGQSSLGGSSPRGCKESDKTEVT